MKTVLTVLGLFTFGSMAQACKDQSARPSPASVPTAVATAVATAVPSQTGTRLEAFRVQHGVVIVQGWSTLGLLHNKYGTVSVDAKELIDASSGKRQSGVTIQVKRGGQFDSASTSYVDYDEIESLLRGLDYIVKVDKPVTKLQNFQADYRTKGGLVLASFNMDIGVISFALSSGASQVFLTLEEVANLRAAISRAKATLDALVADGK